MNPLPSGWLYILTQKYPLKLLWVAVTDILYQSFGYGVIVVSELLAPSVVIVPVDKLNCESSLTSEARVLTN